MARKNPIESASERKREGESLGMAKKEGGKKDAADKYPFMKYKKAKSGK